MKFIGHAYLNRRYTRLVPSCVMAGAIALAYLVAVPAFHGSTNAVTLGGTVIDLMVVALQGLLYPFARETYFRLTGPLRQAAPTLILPLPWLAGLYIGKFLVFMAVLSVTIPLGFAGFLYLSVTERRGEGYRLT